jgi:HNH endonuclease
MTTYVIDRANNRCEYCLFPQTASLFSLEIEHIIAEKHRGETIAENLALACPHCNRLKGSDIGSIDPDTDRLTPLFHPRLQQWTEHFRCEGAEIIPLTPEGRVTVILLQFNHPKRLEERQILIAIGQYP